MNHFDARQLRTVLLLASARKEIIVTGVAAFASAGTTTSAVVSIAIPRSVAR